MCATLLERKAKGLYSDVRWMLIYHGGRTRSRVDEWEIFCSDDWLPVYQLLLNSLLSDACAGRVVRYCSVPRCSADLKTRDLL